MAFWVEDDKAPVTVNERGRRSSKKSHEFPERNGLTCGDVLKCATAEASCSNKKQAVTEISPRSCTILLEDFDSSEQQTNTEQFSTSLLSSTFGFVSNSVWKVAGSAYSVAGTVVYAPASVVYWALSRPIAFARSWAQYNVDGVISANEEKWDVAN